MKLKKERTHFKSNIQNIHWEGKSITELGLKVLSALATGVLSACSSFHSALSFINRISTFSWANYCTAKRTCVPAFFAATLGHMNKFWPMKCKWTCCAGLSGNLPPSCHFAAWKTDVMTWAPATTLGQKDKGCPPGQSSEQKRSLDPCWLHEPVFPAMVSRFLLQKRGLSCLSHYFSGLSYSQSNLILIDMDHQKQRSRKHHHQYN